MSALTCSDSPSKAYAFWVSASSWRGRSAACIACSSTRWLSSWTDHFSASSRATSSAKWTPAARRSACTSSSSSSSLTVTTRHSTTPFLRYLPFSWTFASLSLLSRSATSSRAESWTGCCRPRRPTWCWCCWWHCPVRSASTTATRSTCATPKRLLWVHGKR